MQRNSKSRFFWLIVFCVSIQQISFARPQEVKDNHLKRQAFILFQDMASTGIDDFYNGKISDQSLIRFGVLYNALHHNKRLISIHQGNDDFRISEKYVASAVKYYFGREIKNQSAPASYLKHRNGFYYGDTDIFEDLSPLGIDSFRLLRNNNSYIAYGQWPYDLGDSIENARRYNSWRKKRLDFKRVGTGSKAHFIITGWSPVK